MADVEFYKQKAANLERSEAAAKASAKDWESLYLKEKDRADRVQGGRVEELTKANTELHAQTTADRQKIGELTAENISLRSGRKWWFGVGAAIGAVGGYYIGKNQERIVQTFVPVQNRPQFGATFRF